MDVLFLKLFVNGEKMYKANFLDFKLRNIAPSSLFRHEGKLNTHYKLGKNEKLVKTFFLEFYLFITIVVIIFK